MMFDESPYYAGGAFRTKRQFSAAPVLEDIHFFLDNVGRFTEGSLKKVCRFKCGSANFLIAEAPKKGAGLGFEILKLRAISGPARRSFSEGGKDVFGAANSLVFGHG